MEVTGFEQLLTFWPFGACQLKEEAPRICALSLLMPGFSQWRRRLEKILKGFGKSLFYVKTHLQTWYFVIWNCIFASLKQLSTSDKRAHQTSSFSRDSLKQKNMPLAPQTEVGTKIITRSNGRERHWDSMFLRVSKWTLPVATRSCTWVIYEA